MAFHDKKVWLNVERRMGLLDEGAAWWLKQCGGGGGVGRGRWHWRLSAGIGQGHSMPDLIRSPSVKCWLSGSHWNRGGLLVSLLPLSTNFLAQWSRSNPSGPAHSDALCHSIKLNVLLVSRHVKEVTGKVNLTLNSFSDVLIKKSNRMSERKWHKVNEGLLTEVKSQF